MGQIYDSTRSNIDDGDLSSLVDMHSLSSGLKSLGSDLAANGIETCRRAMGGHGYGGGSGLVQLNADYLSKPTVEGDNWMITQQMARYLLKKVELVVNAPPGFCPSNQAEAALFNHHSTRSTQNTAFKIYLDDRELVSAFERRACSLVSFIWTTLSHRTCHNQAFNRIYVGFCSIHRAQDQEAALENTVNPASSTQPRLF